MTNERGVLVHEWLAEHGGSEKVFDALTEAFPDADLLCLWSDVADRYPDRTLRETWLARSALRRHKALAMPVMLATWRHLRGDYDWALVSSHLFAHHVRFSDAPDDFKKLVYVHSPARYLWVPDLDQRGDMPHYRFAAHPLKWIDRRRAQEPIALAANSRFVARRIEECWGREAAVVHPPVDVERIGRELASQSLPAADAAVVESLPEQFVLGASRLVPYKRLDLVIIAAAKIGLPAVIAGSGPERERLQAVAGTVKVPVRFIEHPSDELLHQLYARASVYIFPPVEDFGIMPVEALAAGTPIVVGPVGGATEIVGESAAGLIADSLRPDAIAEAARAAIGISEQVCRERASDFGHAAFHSNVLAWADTVLGSSPSVRRREAS